MKRFSKQIFIIIIVALLLISANIAQIALVFSVTSSQAKETGMSRLEAVSSELEETINDAKLSILRFAVEVEPFLAYDDEQHQLLESLITLKKMHNIEETDGICFNTYIGGADWHIIPDFDEPEGYEVTERSWYRGAVKSGGEPFVSDPYIDAMTGNVCFTVSVLLTDKQTVVAFDYTMESIQQHIKQMNESGTQQAVIVTEEGIIAGCSDEKLVGKSLVQNIPDYAGIYSLVKNNDSTVSIKQRGQNLFAVHSGFGWYLIVSENNWSLYRTSYIEMLGMLVLSLVIFAIILAMYLRTSGNAKKTQAVLANEREFLKSFTKELHGPADRIINGASIENVKNSTDYEQEFVSIREAGAELSQMLSKLRSYSELDSGTEKGGSEKRNDKPHDVAVSKHFRSIILGALLLVTAICIYINLSASMRYGNGQMQKAANTYEYQLSEWINTQKSILDMFCSNISTDPEMLNDYDKTVEYLDRITRQYPEISVSYMTNPDAEHTVIMNNGWQPDDDWHVEERSWYKELMAADKDWIISSPYYDEQTGLYCVTLAKRVYDDRTGEFLGNFGIDFYMDKLVDILGNSYTDTSYAFLADAKGEIINHPYGKYQMSENGSENIIELAYNAADPNDDSISFIKDYDGKYKAVIATRNEASGFSIYVVDGIVTIYKGVFVYGTICIIVLIACVVIVYKVMTSLIRLQDEANAKLKESADAAIAADKAKSDFLAQMSHEIRTPINAVLGMNEMIIHESDDESIREYAANIQSSGRTLLTLINSILDFSKIEDGKMEIIPSEYETAVMINDLVTSVRPRAKAKELTLRVEADESLPCTLKGDDVRLKQIILNLLTNAVKYTEKGEVSLKIRCESISDDETELYVEVTDTGIGIRQEDISMLFESFRRLEEKRNRHIEGTGLGMSIVTRLLAMMGSELSVSSVYGEGSAFSFRVKQGVINREPMGDYEKRAAADTESTKTGQYLYAPDAKILVVDDNSMNLKVAKNLLSLYGISSDTADSGERALEKIKVKFYDIIFLDHMMPKMDGIEVMKRIKEQGLINSGTTVIALTANAITGAKEMYLEAGFDDYLTKPIESHALEKQLRKSLPESKKQFREPVADAKATKEKAADDSFTFEEVKRLRELCPELNVANGLKNCMDSKEFWLDTLSAFIEADRSAELEKAFENGDTELYRIAVHSVKSAAKTIGADVVAHRAMELEFAARDGDNDFIRSQHEGFIKAYKKLIEEIGKVAGQ